MKLNGIECAIGNHKIGDDTVILNICAARDCPSRKLGLCQVPAGKCYADKAERQYPTVLPFRRRQEEQWDRLTGHGIAERLLAGIIRRKKGTKWLRLNEAGDFRCQEDVAQAEEIAEYLKTRGGIGTYVYTARKDLDFTGCKHLVVNGSGFRVHNEFRAVKDAEGYKIKCGGDCRTCNLCKEKRGILIAVEYH